MWGLSDLTGDKEGHAELLLTVPETCSNLLWQIPRSIIRTNTALDNLSCGCSVDQESFPFGRRI